MKQKVLLALLLTTFFSWALTAQNKGVVILVSHNANTYDKLDVNEKLYARSAFQSFVGNMTLLDDVTVRTESNDAALRQVQKQSQVDASKGLGSEDSAYASDMASKASLRIELSLVKYKSGYKLEYSASNIETLQIVGGASSDSYFELDNIDLEADKISYTAMKTLYGKGYISQIPYSVEVQLTHAEDTTENYTQYILDLTKQIEDSKDELDNLRKDNLTAAEKAEALRKEQALQLKIQAAENAKRKTEEQLRKYQEEKEQALKQKSELEALAEQKRNDLAKKFEEKIKQSQEQQRKLNNEISQGLSLEKRIELIEADRQVLNELESSLISQVDINASELNKKMQEEIDAINSEPWRLAETDANGNPTDKARKYRDSKIKKVQEKYNDLINSANNDLKSAFVQSISTYEKQIEDGIKDLEAAEFVYRSFEPGSPLLVTVGNYDGYKYNWTVQPDFVMKETQYISSVPDISHLNCSVRYKDVTGKNPVEYNGSNDTAYAEYMDLVELADICFRTSTPYLYGTLIVKVKYNSTYGDYRVVFNSFTLRRMEDNVVVAEYSIDNYNASLRGVQVQDNKDAKEKEKEMLEAKKRKERESRQQKQEAERQSQHNTVKSLLSGFISYWTPNMNQKTGLSVNANVNVLDLSFSTNVDFRAFIGVGKVYYLAALGFDDFDGVDETSGYFGLGTSINFGCFRPYIDGSIGYGIGSDSRKSKKNDTFGNFRFACRAGWDLVVSNYTVGLFSNSEIRVGDSGPGVSFYETFGVSLGLAF